MGKISIIKEFWRYFLATKKWWLAPAIIMLLVLGVLIFFASTSSTLSPFIYAVF